MHAKRVIIINFPCTNFCRSAKINQSPLIVELFMSPRALLSIIPLLHCGSSK